MINALKCQRNRALWVGVEDGPKWRNFTREYRLFIDLHCRLRGMTWSGFWELWTRMSRGWLTAERKMPGATRLGAGA
jgi:hypothetical protein